MRLLASLAATAVLLGACGGAATAPTTAPTTVPTATPAPSPTPQLKYVFTADLKTSNEVPAIADAEASCSGKGTFTLSTTKDATGKITAATGQFDLTISGCPTTTMITLFHIHKQVAGQNGGVVVDSGQKAAEPIALSTGGTASPVTKANITVDPALAQDIITTPSGYYFNVHSQLHGGGVIRDQLKPSS
ncbi:MAG TPA: CHRD domain-containing protein [Candidatus Limnocylindria bacterium]|nr:CHRD domain-containing protein [Candidatus Limnocylindria bacterium]